MKFKGVQKATEKKKKNGHNSNAQEQGSVPQFIATGTKHCGTSPSFRLFAIPQGFEITA